MKLASPNPEAVVQILQENKKKADYHFARQHIGLELLVAEGSFSQPESISGHAFLRLIDADENPLNDTIISFSMLPLDPSRTYAKTFGGFPNVPMVGSFAESMINYMRSENRPLRRYVIPATPKLLSHLKTVIRQVIEAPSLINEYHFTQNNCLSGIMKVLKYVGYPIHDMGLIDIPALASNALMMNTMSFYPNNSDMVIVGGSDLIRRINDGFEKNFISRKWSGEEKGAFLEQDAVWETLRTWSEQDIERLVTFWPLDWNQYFDRIQKIADRQIRSPRPLLQIVNIKPLPASIYRLCNIDDTACRDSRKQDAIQNFGEQAMRKHLINARATRLSEVKRTRQLGNDRILNEKLKLLENPVAMELQHFADDFDKQ